MGCPARVLVDVGDKSGLKVFQHLRVGYGKAALITASEAHPQLSQCSRSLRVLPGCAPTKIALPANRLAALSTEQLFTDKSHDAALPPSAKFARFGAGIR
jgi:hypothetical protein